MGEIDERRGKKIWYMNLIPQTAQKDHYLMQKTLKAIIHGRLLDDHVQIIE